jgi:hypothetical protein
VSVVLRFSFLMSVQVQDHTGEVEQA